jgi:hypothetical protein
MSLCPYYCDCRCCRHGVKNCEACQDCIDERQRERRQLENNRSVQRQKSKLRIIEHKHQSPGS